MKKVGYLGPKGTYTEQALKKYFKDELIEAIPFPNIESVFLSVVKDEITHGFVPIENIIQGPVTQTQDYLLRYAGKVNIIGANIENIEHALGALNGHTEIKKIISKDTALLQCSTYLNLKYPYAEKIPVESTSTAMKLIVDKKMFDSAAIGMAASFPEYGLEMVAANVSNVRNNKTRFILFGRGTSEKSGNDVTSIAIYPRRDKVGLLTDVLSIISKEYSLNMSSIHSRPDGQGLFVFYLDIEGHSSDERIKNCIVSLKNKLPDTDIFVFGSYPYLPFNQQRIRTIGIIGGTGKMGQWFKPFFESKGYEVLIAGRGTILTYSECVNKSDAIIINVPIDNTLQVIREIGPLMKKGQLMVDNTAVKMGVVNAMLESTAHDVEVISMHTMFGPNIDDVYGENIILVPTEKTKEISKEFENIFHKYGAKITIATPEEHDKKVLLTQGLEHVTGVAREAAILSCVKHPSELDQFSTPNSRLSQILDGRIHSGDPALYASMIKQNSHSKDILKKYAETLLNIVNGIENGNTDAFEHSMAENKEKLGKNFSEEALEKSNKMLKSIKDEY